MPDRSSSRNLERRTWPVIGSVFLLIAVLIFIFAPQQPKAYPPYVANSASPTGIKAWQTYLKNHFQQVSLWKKPVQALNDSSSGQLMIIIEPSLQLSTEEAAAWTGWLAGGNTLWLLASNPDGVFALETAAAEDPGGNANKTMPRKVTGYAEFEGGYQAVVDTGFRLRPGSADQVLLEDSAGVLAISRRYGQGKLMVLLCPQWLTNESLLENDHLALVLPFPAKAKPNLIWFNEYLHGYRGTEALFDPYPGWYLIILLQSAIALLLWLWRQGRRFEPARIPREMAVRFGDERIRALAAWYERGGFYKESLLIQEEYLHQTIRNKWGISEKSEDQEYEAKARRQIKKDFVDLWLQYWRQTKELAPAAKVSAKHYLRWSNRLAFMQREVEHR